MRHFIQRTYSTDCVLPRVGFCEAWSCLEQAGVRDEGERFLSRLVFATIRELATEGVVVAS